MRCRDGDQDNCAERGPLTGEVSPWRRDCATQRTFHLYGWPGEVERDSLPLDRAENYGAGLLGHDLKEFDLEH